MKIKLSISIILFVTLTGFVAVADWFTFKNEAYAIEFPAKPTTDVKTVNSAVGELKLDITMYDASKLSKNDDNLAYMSMSTEYPEFLISSDNKEGLNKIFRGGIDGAVKRVDGRLLSEKVIQIDGFPGREVRADVKDGLALIKMRFYLVKNKIYMVQVITKTENEGNKSFNRFFNSFKLIK